jgi:Fe2+ or Zn2+ uptake regulation protein
VKLDSPISSVIPGAYGQVLGELARRQDSTTAAQLAKALIGRVGKSRVYEVLEELTESGIVVADSFSGAKLYSLNKDHLAAEAISTLSNLRQILIQRLISEITGWKIQPVSAYLFGSVATDAAGRDSDIDLLLIRPDEVFAEDDTWYNQFGTLRDNVLKWTGRVLHTSIYSLQEWTQMTKDGFNLPREISSSGVLLVGTPVRRFG